MVIERFEGNDMVRVYERRQLDAGGVPVGSWYVQAGLSPFAPDDFSSWSVKTRLFFSSGCRIGDASE